MKSKSVGMTAALHKGIGARILHAAMQAMRGRNDGQEAQREKSRYNRDEARKTYLKGRARWFSGVANHFGKDSSWRMNRKSLGISARQQKRARKALGRLPHTGDYSRAAPWSATAVEKAIADRRFAKNFGSFAVARNPGKTTVFGLDGSADDAIYGLRA